MDTELNTPGMEEVEYLAALLLKQLRHEITDAELQYLENWKASHPSHALVSAQVNDSEQLLNDLLAMKQVDMESRWRQISAQINPVKQPVPLYRRWYVYAAAAIVLIIAGAISWPYLTSKKTLPPVVENKEHKANDFDIPPGSNRAMLTLANGSVINLENAANGEVANPEHSRRVDASRPQPRLCEDGDVQVRPGVRALMRTLRIFVENKAGFPPLGPAAGIRFAFAGDSPPAGGVSADPGLASGAYPESQQIAEPDDREEFIEDHSFHVCRTSA